jgi:3-dehydroquinate dehydratase-2
VSPHGQPVAPERPEPGPARHARARNLRQEHQLEVFQSNAEHALLERIHAARGKVDFILFNPAAFTHTSVALRDALLAVSIPFIEVHLSNVAAREDFRQRSYFADIAAGTIAGFGVASYELALLAANRLLAKGQS